MKLAPNCVSEPNGQNTAVIFSERFDGHITYSDHVLHFLCFKFDKHLKPPLLSPKRHHLFEVGHLRDARQVQLLMFQQNNPMP